MPTKRATVSRGPLDSEAVVQQVLSYVGPGQWLICALVSKKWHELYAEVQSIKQEVKGDLDRWLSRSCTIIASMTLYSAVFASASRVELARSCGLKLRSRERRLQLAAGRHGDAETLLAARKLGMPWADCLLNSIAEQRDLAKLQVLYETKKCRLPIDISAYAACSGSTKLLWLRLNGCAFTPDTVRAAALGGHKKAVKYLHKSFWHKKWDAIACVAAAENCHAVLLCWLLQQNCTWHDQSTAYISAATQNRIDVMDYYFNAGLPLPPVAYLTAKLSCDGAHGSLARCQWWKQHGAPWPDALRYYNTPWTNDAIEWARAEGCTSPL
eukprot:3530-Heterococcus_DN1.PRE.5